MCTTCGCEGSDVRVEGHEHEHVHADGTVHRHPHDHAHDHGHAHAQGLSALRTVTIEEDILAKNDAHAVRNRDRLEAHGIFAVNLVSSPGSGKTSLLVKTIEALADRLPIAVVEGDQQTTLDSERIRATGAHAVQINTGKGCHLDAYMVERAIEQLAPPKGSALMIENVGNLVCPASFDLGEAHKVVVLSVTEGEDKPLKYPDMFRRASLMLLNKIDLLPHLEFDVGQCVENARRINPSIAIMNVSARTGEGLADWLAWIERGAANARARAANGVLERQLETLEEQAVEMKGLLA